MDEDKIKQDYEKIKELLSRIKSAVKNMEQEKECKETTSND